MANEAEFKVKADDKTRAAFEAVDRRLKETEHRTKSLRKEMANTSAQGGTLVSNFAKVGTALLALTAGVGGLTATLGATSEYEKLNAQLITATGSTENASTRFEQLNALATTTPFVINEVVGSFIKLKNLGLDPSERSLRSYGNTASAMGKDLDQLIEAVADASVGEFERLKEFGIKARSQGENVSFTFKGMETTVAKTSEEIQGYLLGLGETDFAGAMAIQSDHLATRFSNLEAATDRLLIKFGESSGLTLAAKQSASGLTNLFNTMAGGHRSIETIKTDITALTARLSGVGAHIQKQLVNKIGVLNIELKKARDALGVTGNEPESSDGPSRQESDAQKALEAQAHQNRMAESLARLHNENRLQVVKEGADQEAHIKRQGHAQMLLDTEAAERTAAQNSQAALMQRVGYMQQIMGNLSSLMGSKNERLWRLGKAAALSGAIINTSLAVTKTMTTVPYPWNIPLAVAQGAAGLVQVANIRSQQFSGAREHGGPVSAGSLYKVNDGAGNDIELFRPNSSGRILNNKTVNNNGGENNFNMTVVLAPDSQIESWYQQNKATVFNGFVDMLNESGRTI